ncbi:MAG: PD40 domain-containing protein [Candidatus Krumholzibacteriota bacterium]|nr:PD40 domain-containing protein [Candidatus Krumholzibacteriota bacterium]
MTTADRGIGSLFAGDRRACIALAAIALAARIPFLDAFDLVTNDGVSYIGQARALAHGALKASVFPVGYPALVALLLPIVRDGVRAAQAVAALAGAGAVIVFFLLCRRWLSRTHAFTAAIVLAITPLFVRLSSMTMSETAYLFWILFGLLLFAKERDLSAGLVFGIAAITRPEALAIAGVLGLIRMRAPRRLFRFAGAFVAAYAVNVAVQSIARDRLVLLTKTESFGSSAGYWKLREAWIDFSGREEAIADVVREGGEAGILLTWLRRLPAEILLLARHATPAVFLLALYGIWRRRRNVLLALFATFLFYPLFTVRSEARFVLPYIPALLFFAVAGLESIQTKRAARIAAACLAVSVAAGLYVNRAQLTEPVSAGYAWTKPAAAAFRPSIEEGALIADRKPFFAFYAGGEYVEIPAAPYDDILDHLHARGVDYLVLHYETIGNYRPVLLTLLFDQAVITGELRYRQFFFHPGVLVYRRNPLAPDASRRELASHGNRTIYGPVWSPDGGSIAYRAYDDTGRGEIRIVSPHGGESRAILQTPAFDDPVSWEPDSRSIVFATIAGGNIDLYRYGADGRLERLTTDPAVDRSPSMSRDGRTIVFVSDRSGTAAVWMKDLESGALGMIAGSEGGAYPAISPGGRHVAWVRIDGGLCVSDRVDGGTVRLPAPEKVNFAPAWHPGGKAIAVTASDWGSTDIYLVTPDGAQVALLTKSMAREGQPAWSPDGREMAFVVFDGTRMSLVARAGLDAHVDRLLDPEPVRVFETAGDRRR